MTLCRVIDSAGEEMRLSVGGELGLITEMLEPTHNFKIQALSASDGLHSCLFRKHAEHGYGYTANFAVNIIKMSVRRSEGHCVGRRRTEFCPMFLGAELILTPEILNYHELLINPPLSL